MCKRLLPIICLLLALGVPAMAQIPLSPVVIDHVKWVGDELQNMVDGHIDVFVFAGVDMLWDIFAILFVWYIIVGIFSSSMRNELLVELVMNAFIASMMLQFYDTPMPWGDGISFHQLFAKEAQWAAATLDITLVNDVVATVLAIYKGLPIPHWTDIFGIFAYVSTLAQLVLIWLFCSGITLIAHIALGVGALFGPITIPFFIWPVMAWLFWGWVRFMVTYALYIISSSAVVYVYAHVIMYFFVHVVGTDYSLGHFSAILLPFAVLNGIFVIAFWQCHSWARDIATGSASMGSSVNSMVQAATLAILA